MKIFIGLILFITLFLDVTLVIISDDIRVYKELTKEQLYKVSTIKDILNAIIIICFALLAFV